jgi:hypothetical protein
MALPKRIKADELEAEGFVIQRAEVAKHEKWHSFRYLCYGCKDWVSQASVTDDGSKDGKEHHYCRSCYVKIGRPNYILA